MTAPRRGVALPRAGWTQLPLTTLLVAFVFTICATVWVPLSIEIGGLNLRLSQMFLPLVAVALLVVANRYRLALAPAIAVLGACLWWGTLTFWTLVNGPEFGRPGGRVLLMALNLTQAAAAYLLVVRVGDSRPALGAWLWSVSILNVFMVAASIAQAAGLPMPSGWIAAEEAPMLVDGEIVAGVVQRFVFGGVLAGCVSAAAGVLAFALWFDSEWRARRLLAIGALLSLIGIVIGFSRQSILSLLLGLLVTGACLVGRGRTWRLMKLATAGVAVALVALGLVLATPQGRAYLGAFGGRAAQFVDPNAYSTGTVAERSIIWTAMWRDIQANPLVGAGQDAYIQYMNVGEGSHNFPLEVWHSAGLAGLAGYLVLHLIGPLAAVGRLVGGRLSSNDRVLVAAMLGVYTAVVVASFTNLIYWNPVYWLTLALQLATIRLAGAVPVART